MTHTTLLGIANQKLKIISEKFDGQPLTTIRLVVEGLSGEVYSLRLFTPDQIESVKGAVREINKLRVAFDKQPKQEFVRKEIVISLK